MATKPGKTVSFSHEQIATIPADSTRALVTAAKQLLAWHEYPASIELDSDRPLGTRGGLNLRAFRAIELGVHGLYFVDASLSGSPLFRSRPVINQASFVMSPESEVLETDDIILLRRGFVAGAQVEASMLQPQSVVTELGFSAMKLVEGVNVPPFEYWMITEKH